MTKLPHESWAVTSANGPQYRVSTRCSNPFCFDHADHAHHIWRRSFVIGDVTWVSLDFEEPPVIVQNTTGLCFQCHDFITRDVTAIKWEDGLFVWEQQGWASAPLDPQPVRLDAVDVSLTLDPHGEHDDAEVCPTCKRSKRKKTVLPPGEKRKRKSWTVKVPDDAENGADVLDELVAIVADNWNMQYESALGRYHVLVPVLYAVIQNDIQIGE
jgi:hypothetical protein